jgi:amino acid/amide ABC transporter membrane protein 1, HAAT family (TC 3.A.1.4.-)
MLERLKILGVDTEKVYAATFGINAALCGVAGALISITFTLGPYVGLPYTVRSFMIVIVCGPWKFTCCCHIWNGSW